MLAKRIRSLRIEKTLTQAELAKLIGVSQQTIGSWEVGRTAPNHEFLICLAKIFNCSAEYLLGMTDKRTETVEDHLLDKEIGSAIYELAVVTSSNPKTYKREFPPQTVELLRQELGHLLTSEEIDLEMTPADFDQLMHEIDDPEFKQEFLDALKRVISLQALTALKANQLQINVANNSIFHGKPEKLQDHVNNLDKMEPALAEKLLQKIASSAELFPRSTQKLPDMNIIIVDEKTGEDLPDPISSRSARKIKIRKSLSVAASPEQTRALLQLLGRSSRMKPDELQNRLGMLPPDDYANMLKIFSTVLAGASGSEKSDSK